MASTTISTGPLVVALDVSLDETTICALDERGTIAFETVAASDPEIIAATLHQHRSGIALECEQILAAANGDLLRDRGPAGERIQADYAAA